MRNIHCKCYYFNNILLFLHLCESNGADILTVRSCRAAWSYRSGYKAAKTFNSYAPVHSMRRRRWFAGYSCTGVVISNRFYDGRQCRRHHPHVARRTKCRHPPLTYYRTKTPPWSLHCICTYPTSPLTDNNCVYLGTGRRTTWRCVRRGRWRPFWLGSPSLWGCQRRRRRRSESRTPSKTTTPPR